VPYPSTPDDQGQLRATLAMLNYLQAWLKNNKNDSLLIEASELGGNPAAFNKAVSEFRKLQALPSPNIPDQVGWVFKILPRKEVPDSGADPQVAWWLVDQFSPVFDGKMVFLRGLCGLNDLGCKLCWYHTFAVMIQGFALLSFLACKVDECPIGYRRDIAGYRSNGDQVSSDICISDFGPPTAYNSYYDPACIKLQGMWHGIAALIFHIAPYTLEGGSWLLFRVVDGLHLGGAFIIYVVVTACIGAALTLRWVYFRTCFFLGDLPVRGRQLKEASIGRSKLKNLADQKRKLKKVLDDLESNAKLRNFSLYLFQMLSPESEFQEE
jgi:hypothetical protein